MDSNVKDAQASHEQDGHTSALEACQLELADLKNRYARIHADFQNAERRMQEERAQWARMAQSDVLTKLLPVIDNFDRAFAEKEKEPVAPELEGWFKGFAMIAQDLHKLLDKMDVKEVEAKHFDPEFHEAVYSAESDLPSGSIVQVYEKGYTFKGRVLRPAKVSVAK